MPQILKSTFQHFKLNNVQHTQKERTHHRSLYSHSWLHWKRWLFDSVLVHFDMNSVSSINNGYVTGECEIYRERVRAIGKTCNLVGILYNRKMWRHIIYGVQRLTVETDSIDFEWPIKNCTFLIPHRMVFRSMIQFNVNPYTNIKVWNWGVFGSYLSGWWDWSLAMHTHTHSGQRDLKKLNGNEMNRHRSCSLQAKRIFPW